MPDPDPHAWPPVTYGEADRLYWTPDGPIPIEPATASARPAPATGIRTGGVFIANTAADPSDPSSWTHVGLLTDDGLTFEEPAEPVDFAALRTSHAEDLRFTTTITPAAMAALFGDPLPEPTHAVTLEWADEVYGGPVPPLWPTPRHGWRGWWDRLTGARARSVALYAAAERSYFDAYAAWHEAGCPPKVMQSRLYVPSAHVTTARTPATEED